MEMQTESKRERGREREREREMEKWYSENNTKHYWVARFVPIFIFTFVIID